jgi:hypothetical protein
MNNNHREKREAKKDGAKPVRNSGRGFRKGDATWREFLIDYKHNAKSFTLTLKAWRKHATDAWNEDHRIPCIKVVYEDGTEVGIVPWDTVRMLEVSEDEIL